MIKKISFIGSGNVASVFAEKFSSVNIDVINIISRNQRTGKELAQKVNAKYYKSIRRLDDCDMIFICTNDDNIVKISEELPDILVAHTSGNTSISSIKGKKRKAVIYPIQSLSKNEKVSFNEIPFCIEASDLETNAKIHELISKISKNIHTINSSERKLIHMSAVIASNFSNFCYIMAYEILKEKNISFDLLKPLIKHTAEKNLNREPKKNLTGPATRRDFKTIKEHLALIDNKNYKKIYDIISKTIIYNYEK